MRAAEECVPRGIKALGFPGVVAAYIKTYNPRSYAGARASASRLMRRLSQCAGLFTNRLLWLGASATGRL